MDKSNVLLSQPEIDALLDFLTEKKVSSTTMDQESIDRLINFLQSSEGQKFTPKTGSEDSFRRDVSVLILPNNENISVNASFLLNVTILPDDHVALTALNAATGTSYKITPDCVEQGRYLEDNGADWGVALAPSCFDYIARLLNAKYTRETYETVCKKFAKNCYGSEAATLPNLYLPSKASMIENMII